MLSIKANKLGKKFNREWIFRDLDYHIPAGQKLAVLGANGSGKSTLLQVISGFMTPNEGELIYTLEGREKPLAQDQLKDHIAFASPYLQLVEELSLQELVEHVSLYKPFISGISAAEVIERMELKHAANKLIRQFSSGMKQRVKLGLAFLSNAPLLLLDEPTSNLDRNAIEWYRLLVNSHTGDRTVIVCSNAISEEYFFCSTQLHMADFKPRILKI